MEKMIIIFIQMIKSTEYTAIIYSSVSSGGQGKQTLPGGIPIEFRTDWAVVDDTAAAALRTGYAVEEIRNVAAY